MNTRFGFSTVIIFDSGDDSKGESPKKVKFGKKTAFSGIASVQRADFLLYWIRAKKKGFVRRAEPVRFRIRNA